LNYTGKAREYVAKRAATESTKVKEVLDRSLAAVDSYLESLRSIDKIPELLPSEAQSEAFNRRFAQQVARSFKKAEANSIFLSLVSKQTLLYGSGSIDYFPSTDGEMSRSETSLQEHSVEIEIPRQQHLDPFGLE